MVKGFLGSTSTTAVPRRCFVKVNIVPSVPISVLFTVSAFLRSMPHGALDVQSPWRGVNPWYIHGISIVERARARVCDVCDLQIPQIPGFTLFQFFFRSDTKKLIAIKQFCLQELESNFHRNTTSHYHELP